MPLTPPASYLPLLCCLSTLILHGCSDDGKAPEIDYRSINGTYLHITPEDSPVGTFEDQHFQHYFGARHVGTDHNQPLRIANRGADVYTLNKVRVIGDNAEEFITQVMNPVTLEPAHSLTVDVTFMPFSEGNKAAEFVLDYDVTTPAGESANINEQSYYQASTLESAGQFNQAQTLYQDYLSGDPETVNRQRAAIRLPIIEEYKTYQQDEELSLYLEALQQREQQDSAQALQSLKVFSALYSDSYLADDALYLQGYIQLMDRNQPAESIAIMQTLRQNFPDTNYYDTSLYSDAMARIELGEISTAQAILNSLRDRHTGIDTLGIQLPKDNMISRLWFQRATEALEALTPA